MAATLTPDGELTYFSFPIEKTAETEDVNPVDGTPDIIVYGKATDGSVDSDLQIVDPEWSAKAIRDWLDTGGNLRVQHQARRDPAGVGLEVDITPDGHFVKALVTEPVAKHLVRTRTLQDFSIGVTHPDIRPDPNGKAMNGIITGRHDGMSKISEISLVDRGSNFNSKFQLVKAAGDGAPEFVGKMFTPTESVTTAEIMAEDGLVKTVEVEFGRRYEKSEDDGLVKLTAAITPADLAKMLTGHAGVAKRKMDPDVGGGVDRDKIPAADFAGRDRSFPIVTPGDVSDAASSIGRAGSDNYSGDQLKKNIIRIARRKGASFVAELPESWKKELSMDGSEKDTEIEVVKTEDDDTEVDKSVVETDVEKKKKQLPPFLKDDDKGDDGDDDPKAEKLSGSGEGEAGDADDAPGEDDNDDDEDGKDDPDSEKSVAVDVEKVITVEKKSKVMCTGCGANVHDEHKFCPECGDKLNDALPIKKNHSFTCLDCGYQLDNGEKFCPECGTKHPGYNPAEAAKAAGDDGSADKATAKLDKKAKKAAKIAKKATPTDVADEAADADPVPEHREPDGPAIEALEHDAGLPTVPDSSVKTAEIFFPGDLEASASMRLKMLNVPTDYGMLHDLTCPCYHPDDVAKSYPTYDLTRVDVGYWQRKAFDMAASAPLEEARKATELWQHVVTLKGTDPRYLAEVRSDLYKEFRDANPGPGTFPTPGAIHPGSFNHPLMTASHAAASPGYSGPNTSPESFGQISASMYDRGALTAGHASESPSANRGAGLPVSIPTNPGVPTRTYYTNAMRNNARQAMSAMHDHIASTFPDLCPAYTTAGPYGGDALPGSRPVPAGVGGPTPHGATKAAKKGKKKNVIGIENPAIVEPIPVEMSVVDKAADVTKAATLDMDVVNDIVTKAVTAVNEARDAEVADLKKTLRKMRKQVETLAAQPDPGGPYRGIAFDQITKSVATQEVLPSVQRVEHAQEAMFRAMYDQFRNDPSPMQREAALRELMKMSGITSNSMHK